MNTYNRSAFEAFAMKNNFGSFAVVRDTRKGQEDGYWSSHTQIMWEAWKAAIDFAEESRYDLNQSDFI